MNEHYFDQLTKLAAGNLPRREALRRFGAVVGGALLGSLGLGRSVTVAQTAGNSQGCAAFCSRYRTLSTKNLCLATCRTCPSHTFMCGGTSINSVTCCTSGNCVNGVCGPSGNRCSGVICPPPEGSGPCQITYTCNPTTGKCDRRDTTGVVCGSIDPCNNMTCLEGECAGVTPANENLPCGRGGNECLIETCSAGSCIQFYQPPLTTCSGGTCDGRGNCGSRCPDPVPDDPCEVQPEGYPCSHPEIGEGFCSGGLCWPRCAD